MLHLHRLFVRLKVRMEELEDRVEQRVSNALGGFQTLVEDAFDSVEAYCLELKAKMETPKPQAFPQIPAFP